MLRTGQPDGQVRPAARQVHGLLHAVPRRRRPQRRERGHRHHQDQADHRVRRLVPDRVQGGHQLPAADRGAGRRSGQSAAGGVHAVQHDGHRRGVGPARPQVRPDVRETGVRPLVRRRGHGGRRVFRGQGGLGGAREGLRGGGHGLDRGRRRSRRRDLKIEKILKII